MVRSGTVPVAPPPAQEISQVTVARSVEVPPAGTAVYVMPHVGDAFAGSVPAVHGVPGPLQVADGPPLADHCTFVGFAVAVTDNPPADAVAEREPQVLESTHNQVGTYRTCATGGCGFTLISGLGRRKALTASCASNSGPGPAPKIRNWVTGQKFVAGSPQAPTYQAAGGVGVPPNAIATARSLPVASWYQQPSPPYQPLPGYVARNDPVSQRLLALRLPGCSRRTGSAWCRDADVTSSRVLTADGTANAGGCWRRHRARR